MVLSECPIDRGALRQPLVVVVPVGGAKEDGEVACRLVSHSSSLGLAGILR